MVLNDSFHHVKVCVAKDSALGINGVWAIRERDVHGRWTVLAHAHTAHLVGVLLQEGDYLSRIHVACSFLEIVDAPSHTGFFRLQRAMTGCRAWGLFVIRKGFGHGLELGVALEDLSDLFSERGIHWCWGVGGL